MKRFQERNGLIPDGYLGPKTKKLLLSGDAQANALMIGMSGDDVENVQRLLKSGVISMRAHVPDTTVRLRNTR